MRWGYCNSQGDVKQTVNVDGLFVRSSTIKSIFTTLQEKFPPSTPSSPVSNPPLILHSQTPYTTSPILVKQTDWCYILGSPKSTNLVTYETYTNHNHLLSPVLFPSGRENFMRTTFSILTCPDCEHSSEEHIPRDYWVILHRCRSCNKMLKPHAGNCCVFCSYGSVKCNGEQNSAIGALKVIWSGFNSLKPTQWSTPPSSKQFNLTWCMSISITI